MASTQNPTANSILYHKIKNDFPYDQEQVKDFFSHLSYSTFKNWTKDSHEHFIKENMPIRKYAH